MKNARYLAGLLAVSIICSTAVAKTYTWDASVVGNGDWSDPTKWDVDGGGSDGTLPGASDSVVLKVDSAANSTVTLDVDATVNSVAFAWSGTFRGFTLNGTNTLTASQFSKVNAVGPAVSAPLVLTQDTIFSPNNQSGGFEFSGNISDGGNDYKIILEGGGQLLLNAFNNSFSGVDVRNGQLRIGAGTLLVPRIAMPLGAVANFGADGGAGDGTLFIHSSGNYGDATNQWNFLDGAGTRRIITQLNDFTASVHGNVLLEKNVTVNLGSIGSDQKQLTFTGPITGDGGFIIDDPNVLTTLIIAGTGNTLTGDMQVLRGELSDTASGGNFGSSNILVGELGGLLTLLGGEAVSDFAVLNVEHTDAANTGTIFVANGVTEVVGDFQINGVSQGFGLFNESLGGVYADIFAGSDGGWIQVIPEPTSLAFLAMGAAVVLLRRQR